MAQEKNSDERYLVTGVGSWLDGLSGEGFTGEIPEEAVKREEL